MKYEPKQIEFETLENGDFSVSLLVFGENGQRSVKVNASELQGMDFIQVVSLFRARINQSFAIKQ